MQRKVTTTRAISILVGALAVATTPLQATAQGCEPVRFTTPVNLGGGGEAYQRSNEWQFTLAYRRLESTRWFVGTQDRSSYLAGGPPDIKVNTTLAAVSYSINDRYHVQLSVPFSSGSFSRQWGDGVVHAQHATGIGDVSLVGEGWLLAPRTHAQGNVSFGLGVKAPTGNYKTRSQFFLPTGAIDFPADQPIEPGDGGWGVILQSDAFRQLSDRIYGYASGSYLVNPKAHTDVTLTPLSSTLWSVPDVYSARVGGAFSVLPEYGVTMSLGGRVDGVPVHDLVGGGDDNTIKRTFYVLYADPGVSIARGKGTFTLSVPYRVHANRMPSEFERVSIQNGRSKGLDDAALAGVPGALNGGGLAKYLVFLSYTHRL